MSVIRGRYYPISNGERFDPDTQRARATGEFRPPLKGEWFLSGAVIEAYEAPNDLSTAYHIAEIENGVWVKVWRPDPMV